MSPVKKLRSTSREFEKMPLTPGASSNSLVTSTPKRKIPSRKKTTAPSPRCPTPMPFQPLETQPSPVSQPKDKSGNEERTGNFRCCLSQAGCPGLVLSTDKNRSAVKTAVANANIKLWVEGVNDTSVIATLVVNGYELHAADAVYHLGCYTALRDRYKRR